MYKKQMLFERIICFAVIVVSALVFVYALGVITNVNENFRSFYDAQEGEIFPGAIIVKDMQPFVDSFIGYSLGALVVSLSLFITGAHKRRRYYITNYLSVCAVTVANVFLSVWAMVKIGDFKARYNEIDFEAFEALHAKTRYKDHYFRYSTFWFDIGYVIFGVLLAVTVLLVANAVIKIILMRNEAKLLKGAEGDDD